MMLLLGRITGASGDRKDAGFDDGRDWGCDDEDAEDDEEDDDVDDDVDDDDDGGEDCGDDGGWCKIGASKAESSRCRQAHQLHQTSTPPLYHRQHHHQLLLHQTFMNLVSPTLPLT